MNTFTVTTPIHFTRNPRKQKTLRIGEAPVPSGTRGRVPRISRLMALALHIDQLVHDGTLRNYADAARLGHVTLARMSQVTNLLCLAPDIIEELLHLPRIERGKDPITERDLRPIAAMLDWKKQRMRWREVR